MMNYLSNNILQASILTTAAFFGCDNPPSPLPTQDAGSSLDIQSMDTGSDIGFNERPDRQDASFDAPLSLPDRQAPRDIPAIDRRLGLPTLRLEAPYTTLPTGCDFPSDLFVSRESDGREMINVVCNNSRIYFFNPMEAGRPIVPRPRSVSLTTTLPDGGVQSQSLGVATPFEDNRFIITANNGFYITPLELEPTRIVTFFSFPLSQNTGGGSAYFRQHGRLLVTTANIAIGSGGITYNDGTVLVYEVIDRFSVVRVPMQTITTSHKNPTGIIALDDNRAAVLNSGPFNPPLAASIDIIDVRTMGIIRNIPLGAVTASLPGRLALTNDGRLAVGTSNGEHRFFLVNPDTGEITSTMVDGAFHGSINTGASLVFVSLFNEGRVVVFDPTQPVSQVSMSLGFSSSGTAVYYGGCLLQTGPSRIVRVCPE